MPIFTRLLSHEDFGLYSNYASWLHTFAIFVFFHFGVTFISARYDFKDDYDGYISSVLSLSAFSTPIWLLIINLFPSWFSNVS